MINDFYGVCNHTLKYDFNVKNLIDDEIIYTLNRLCHITEITGLPETIPERDLKLLLLTNGWACISKVKDDFYAFFGGLGGEPNAYYRPTICTVSNPYLNFSANLKIGQDCEIVPNDSLHRGVLPLISKYITLLSENFVSMNMCSINGRVQSMITTGNDKDKKAAEKFLEDLKNGKISVLSENRFIDGVKTTPLSNSSSDGTIKNLIEYHQYLRGIMWNDLGIGLNYNMKRESIGSGEASKDDDILLTLIDDMIMSQEEGFQKVNDLYGLNIHVKKSGVWLDLDNEQRLEVEKLESEVEKNEENKNELSSFLGKVKKTLRGEENEET